MRRMFSLSVVACGMALVGCRSAANQAPYSFPPLEELKTSATYDVLQTAEGSSTGGVLLWIFPIGLEDKQGQQFVPESSSPLSSLFGLLPNAEARVRSAALYNAIEAQPGADALLVPRFETETTSYFFYKQVTARCRGKAIRYNPSTNQ